MAHSLRRQLSRRKGWRMEPGGVSVARPTKWGNPFVVVRAKGVRVWFVTWKKESVIYEHYSQRVANVDAVARHGWYLLHNGIAIAKAARRDLRGKLLYCWCRLEDSCHADNLLSVANEEATLGMEKGV